VGGGSDVSVSADSLRASFLDEVRVNAARARAEGDRQVTAMRAEAERRGRALVAEAHAEGVAAARIVGRQDQAAARRRARAIVLAAKRELYEELCRQAKAAAGSLRDDPGYPALLEQLVTTARAQLGEDAVLEVDPRGAGGVRGSSGTRHVDYTLDALAERCLERLGGGLERLWS
jgi:vacuolar-type H+-ATPase subunit E/Vma4